MAELYRENEYTIDELESDINHCYHLIDAAVTMLSGNSLYEEKAASERVASFTWVARDLLEQMSKKIEAGGGRPRV